MARRDHEDTCRDFNCTECWYVLSEEELDDWLDGWINYDDE